jgi:hypothetical protein
VVWASTFCMLLPALSVVRTAVRRSSYPSWPFRALSFAHLFLSSMAGIAMSKAM